MCVVPAFVQNTVDSLPQYTVTTVTTNDVLISSLSTENYNVLTEITTIPEFDTTDKADRFLTTEINQITISSSVPTKMFKGDDLNFNKNDMPDITTIEPITTDSVTITEPSIKLFDEYTTKNEFNLSDEREENENKVSSTTSPAWIDSDEKTTPITTTDINEENETNTNIFQHVTSEPNFKISTVSSLINNSDQFIEISTQYFVPQKVENTTLYENNTEVITFNDSTESTLMTTTTNSQTSTTENNMSSTQLQKNSFEATTLNPLENETKYFNDYFDENLSLTTDTSDVSIDPNLITESVTKSQNKINIQSSEVLEDLSSTTTIGESNTFFSTVESDDFKIKTTDDLINKIDTTTQNVIRGYDSNIIEITTKNNRKNLIVLNNDDNNNELVTSTMFDNDIIYTSTDKSILLFNKNEPTESSTNPIISQTSNDPLNVDTKQNVLETTSNSNLIPSTVQSISENFELTTENSNESMNSRTIYFDEENEMKYNVQGTTKSYLEINTRYDKNNSTESPSVIQFSTTTVPTELDNNLQVKNISSLLETTTSNVLPVSISTIENQEGTTLVTLNEFVSSEFNDTTDLSVNEETTTKSYILETTFNYLNEVTDQYNENDQELTTKSSENIVDVFTINTTDIIDEEKKLLHTTDNPTTTSMTTIEDIRIDTDITQDDGTSTISKKLNGIATTSINLLNEDLEITTVNATNKNKIENDFTLVSTIETTLRPMTISPNAEIITSNNQIDEYTTVNSVMSNNSTEENTQRPTPTDDVEAATTVTALNQQVTNESVESPSNSIDKNDEVMTSAPEFTTQIVESSIIPGSININDSNVSQGVIKKWEMLFGGTGSTSVPSVSESTTVMGTLGLTTVINGMEDTVLNTEPTETIASKEIFSENHRVTNDSVNNYEANTKVYDSTTTDRTRGKNESVITSTSAADRDDTISANEMYTMDNEATTKSDFERKNESIVSTQIQGDPTDNILVGGDQTTQQIMTFGSVNNTLFETTTNTPVTTDSAIFTSKDTDFKYANRETTTVTIITMADWIKTKSTTSKASSNEIDTEKSVVNNLFNSPTDSNVPENGDSFTTDIPLEPLAKTDAGDQVETSSIISINDATTMINLFTTSIEVLVSSLNTENDSTTTAENIPNDAITNTFTENYEITTFTSSNKSGFSNTSLNPNEITYDLTTIRETTYMAPKFNDITDSPTERFTVLPTEETTFNSRTDSPYYNNDFNYESTSRDTDQDTTDMNNNNNNMLTTTEYTITSKSIEIEDVTVIPANHNQTNINNSYSVQQIITTATRKWCWNDTDCDAGHKCLAAKCLPTGESRVNNCPPGIITLQCLKGIIYT